MLHFLYRNDPAKYPDERQRVQQAFLMIIHAYSGLRPSSTTGSSTGKVDVKGEEKIDKKLAKLRCGDFTLLLTADQDGRPRFAVRPLFTRFKNEMQRAQRSVRLLTIVGAIAN